MSIFRRKSRGWHEGVAVSPAIATLVEQVQQISGGEPEGFTAVLIGRRADGPGNGIVKYTLSVHGPGQYVIGRLKLALTGRIDQGREILQGRPGQLPNQLGDIPVAMGPRVLRFTRTEYRPLEEAERVLASKRWSLAGDWVALVGRGRWLTGDHGSWAVPVVAIGRRRGRGAS